MSFYFDIVCRWWHLQYSLCSQTLGSVCERFPELADCDVNNCNSLPHGAHSSNLWASSPEFSNCDVTSCPAQPHGLLVAICERLTWVCRLWRHQLQHPTSRPPVSNMWASSPEFSDCDVTNCNILTSRPHSSNLWASPLEFTDCDVTNCKILRHGLLLAICERLHLSWQIVTSPTAKSYVTASC
jgi:hypothetical protein